MLEFLPTLACLCDPEIVTWSLCSLIFPLVQWPKELAFSGIVRVWGYSLVGSLAAMPGREAVSGFISRLSSNACYMRARGIHLWGPFLGWDS